MTDAPLIPNIPDTEWPTSASDLVRDNALDYLQEIFRMQFPSAIDGLKKIHMRALWVARKGTFNDATKSQVVVGALNEIHPYGDTAAYEALARLAQSWKVNPPLIAFTGNVGTYSDSTPAKMRYTQMEITTFARDVFYGGIDLNVLPMRVTPDGDLEPLYFVPAIPTALLYDNLSIGYGYQSDTVALNLGNICDLVADYALHQGRTAFKPFEYGRHIDKFLPDFPNPCVLTNANELRDAYKKGEFDVKITLDGHVILAQDEIVIQSLPTASAFGNIKSKIEEAIRDKSGLFEASIQAVYDLAPSGPIGGISVELRRGANVFDVWEALRKLIRFSDSMVPNPYYTTPAGQLIRLTPPVLLAIWFAKRRMMVMASKRRKLESMQRELRILAAQILVFDHVDEVIAIIRKNDLSEAIAQLQQRFDLSNFQATALTKVRLEGLARSSRQDLIGKRDKLADEIERFNQSFGKIGEEIADEAKRIKKLYHTERRTKIPTYIGAVLANDGIIQLESTAEVVDIIGRFPKGPLQVTLYDGPYLFYISPEGKISRQQIPKYAKGNIYGLAFSGENGYTVNLQDGTGCCVKGLVPGKRSDGYYYTTKFAKALTRKGQVRSIDVTKEFGLRKSISRGLNTDVIYLYPNTEETHYLAILNDQEPNMVHLQRVGGRDDKIVVSPVGTLLVSHHFTGMDWYLSLPDAYLNRVNARVLHLLDVEAILGTDRQVKLDLASNKTKRNPLVNLLV